MYEDRTVIPGERYDYRLMVDGPDGPRPMGFATATVPLPPSPPTPAPRATILELPGRLPNPSVRGLNVAFSFCPGREAVELDVF